MIAEINKAWFYVHLKAYFMHHRKKYTDPLTDTPLRCLNEPNHPQPTEEKFDDSPLTLGEIKDFVRKAQAKSSP